MLSLFFHQKHKISSAIMRQNFPRLLKIATGYPVGFSLSWYFFRQSIRLIREGTSMRIGEKKPI